MRYLVTGANGDIGEAIGRIIKEQRPDAEVHGADALGLWPGQAVFDTMHQLPRGDDGHYIDALENLARKVRADLIIPATEPELFALSTAGSAPRPSCVMPPPEIVRTFIDKLETARWLNSQGFPVPETTLLSEAKASSLPLFLKSARGYGNRGYMMVADEAALESAKKRNPSGFVAQKFIPGDEEEYTCALVRLGGVVRTLVMRRQLDGSKTMRIEIVDHPVTSALLVKMANALNLDGSINVQLKMTPEGPMIFEINPRFSGTVMMRHKVGFQDLLWTLQWRSERQRPPEFNAPIGARVFRAAREIVTFPESSTQQS